MSFSYTGRGRRPHPGVAQNVHPCLTSSSRRLAMCRNALQTAFVVCLLMLLVGETARTGQSQAADFELSVLTTANRMVTVQCVRGCKLVVATKAPETELRWKVFTEFSFTCKLKDCSSGQVLGGVVAQSLTPDFNLWVSNSTERTAIRCVRGCKFAASTLPLKPDDPSAMRVQEIRFPCSGESCASGRISGWIEP
jgi:hypothetical protein